MTMKQTSKSKLDAALGITSDKTIDDFLESISLENDSAKEAVEKIDSEVKKELLSIDNEINNINNIQKSDYNDKIISITSIEKSLKNIDELIVISKDIIKHIYENIACTELVDSELIHAAATFIESCHLNIKEYIDLYKDRLKFFDKVQFEILQQKHKKELLDYKHKLDMEKEASKAIDVNTTENMVQFDHDAISKILKNENF